MPAAFVHRARAEQVGHVGGVGRIVKQNGQQSSAFAGGIVQLSESRSGNIADLLFEFALLFPKRADDPINLAKLPERNRAGDFIHPKVQSQHATAPDFHSRAQRRMSLVMRAKGQFISLFRSRGDEAAIACGDRLIDIQRERAHLSDPANLPSAIRRSRSLARVFDYHEAMLVGDGHDRVHVARVPQHVNGHDRPRFRCDPTLDVHRVNIEAFINVAENRCQAEKRRRAVSRNKCVSRHDDFVARFQPRSLQTTNQSARPGTSRQGVRNPDIFRKFLLQRENFAGKLGIIEVSVSAQMPRRQNIHHMLLFLITKPI